VVEGFAQEETEPDTLVLLLAPLQKSLAHFPLDQTVIRSTASLLLLLP